MPEVKALTSNLKRRSGSSNAELVARELQVLNRKPYILALQACCARTPGTKRIHIYMFVHVYMYTCMYSYTHIHFCTRIHIYCTRIHVYMYVHVYTYTFLYTYTYIHVCTRIHTCSMYTCIYMYIHIQVVMKVCRNDEHKR